MAALVGVVFMFAACTKVETAQPILDKGQHIISIQKYGGIFGTGFSNSNLVFDPTSTDEQFQLNLEYFTDHVASNDISVTLAVDPTKLTAYNDTVTDVSRKYFLLPDSAYSLPTTPIVIKAGNTISEPFFITFHPDKIDASINYMLPVAIKTITGAPADVKAGPGTGIAFLHFIGNPLAGFYNVVGTRYNYTGSVSWPGPPAPLPAGGTPSAIPTQKFALPIDAHTIQLDFAALGAGVLDYEYLITATPDYSNISVGFSPAFLGASSSRQVFISGYIPPSPGVKPEFHIITHYNNAVGGGGNDRIIDEYFRHQ